jgi:acetyl esterase/lipase
VARGTLPLVLFFHAYDDGDPRDYRSWIDHLVRRGAIVVWPDWQPTDAAATDFARVLPDTLAAVDAALGELGRPGHPQPDLDRVAAVGHSYGAILAAAYAAHAAARWLPVPMALLLAMPGCSALPPAACEAMGSVAALPASTLVLDVTGTDNTVAAADPAWLWVQLGAVPADRKDFVTLRSDAHGAPPLAADHFVAATDGWAVLNAFDWYGTWKWFDALMSCSFVVQDCRYALGNTPEQRFMGTWGDGMPVEEPVITEEPGTPTP